MTIIDGISIVGILVLVVSWLVFLPLMAWFYYQFISFGEEPHFRKRRFSILGLNFLLSVCHIALYRTNTILSMILQVYDPLRAVDSFFWAFTMCGLMYTYLLRVWLFYFDQNYTQAKLIVSWKRDMDRAYVKRFLQNKATWGTNRWMFQWLLIIWFIQMLIIVIVAATGNDAASFYVEGLFVLVPFIGILALWYFTSPHTDFFQIRNELKYFMIAAVAGSFLAFCFSFIQNVRLRQLLYSIVSSTTITAFMLISTWWVIRVYVVSSDESDATAVRNVNHMDEIFKLDSDRASEEADLYSILKNNEGLETFLEHLIQEFAAENMLFLVDVTQLKESLGVLKTLPPEMTQDNSPFTLALPSDLPVSRLFEKFDDPVDRARAIYVKYCRPDSRYKVHVSSQIREELSLFFERMYPPPKRRRPRDDDDEEKDDGELRPNAPTEENTMTPSELDLFAIFDHARNEVLIMLRASFIRFRQTPQFEQLSQNIVSIKERNPPTRETRRSKSREEQHLQGYITTAQVVRDDEPSAISLEMEQNTQKNASGNNEEEQNGERLVAVEMERVSSGDGLLDNAVNPVLGGDMAKPERSPASSNTDGGSMSPPVMVQNPGDDVVSVTSDTDGFVEVNVS